MFIDPKKIDVKKAAAVLGGLTIFWTGLATLLPANIHSTGLIIIAALSNAVTYFIKAEEPQKKDGEKS